MRKMRRLLGVASVVIVAMLLGCVFSGQKAIAIGQKKMAHLTVAMGSLFSESEPAVPSQNRTRGTERSISPEPENASIRVLPADSAPRRLKKVADTLVRGEFDLALELYRQLAQDEPDNRAYQLAVEILHQTKGDT